MTRALQLIQSPRRCVPFFILIAIFSAANLAIFSFPEAIFWDDWTIFGSPKEELLHHFTQAGFPQSGYMFWFLSFLGPGGVRVLVFGLSVLSMILWFRVLLLTPFVRVEAAVLGVGIACSAPFFLARVAAINVGSVIAMFVFLLGWFVLLKSETSGKPRVAVSGLVLIFSAGAIYSAYIPMQILVFLHGALIFSRRKVPIPWKEYSRRVSGLLLLHALLLFLQRQAYPPTGSYESYLSIVIGPGQVLLAMVGIAVIFVFVFTLSRSALNIGQKSQQWRIDFLLFGVIAYLLAISPYVLIGEFPPYLEWKTRYEVNYFIPATIFLLIVLDFLHAFATKKARIVVAMLLVSSAVVYSNFLLSRFFVDWQKHDFVAEILTQNKEVRGKFVMFVDETEQFNAMNRTLRPYEWSGILSEATNSRDTFGVRATDYESEYAKYLEGRLGADLNSDYNYKWRNHLYPSEGVLVIIRRNDRESCGFSGLTIRNCLSVEVNAEYPGAY